MGLEAQHAAVAAHVLGRGEVVAEYVEVESGKRSDRPELALAEAKRAGAVLLIAKLDRLARNAAFTANLLESDVEVKAADMPEANRFVLHIMAAVAEQEGQAISERTKAARKGAAVNKARALAHAENVFPVVEQIRAGGASLRKIAAEMNTRGIKTARGGKWHATTVRNTLTAKNGTEAVGTWS